MSAVQIFWKHREKEELLVMINFYFSHSSFSFSHIVYYTFGKLSAIFIKFEIIVCNLFQFERVWNVLRKGLNGTGLFGWQNDDRVEESAEQAQTAHNYLQLK